MRGEDIKMDAQNMEINGENRLHAVITDTEVMGNENNLYFTFGGTQAVARVSKYEISQIGDRIDFVFMPSKMHFFDKETGVNYMEMQ
nr:TOBE domain-containing protein [uncultured Alistipes sp.]